MKTLLSCFAFCLGLTSSAQQPSKADTSSLDRGVQPASEPNADAQNADNTRSSSGASWPWVVGIIASFLSGGFAGAVYTRWQVKKDREAEKKLPRLTLRTTQEKAELGSSSIHKEFELINNTAKDVDACEIVFEFDVGAAIVHSETRSHQGVNHLQKTIEQDNKHGYQIAQLNREEKIIFVFSIDRFTDNKCRAYINCKGFGLVCIDRNIIDLPSIQPNKFEAQ
ncbi:MAG: hypothetical protein IPM12_04585 [Flavobacteriales bacterium]|nr:hypothetical protein [Flavobacteriales bacterium]